MEHASSLSAITFRHPTIVFGMVFSQSKCGRLSQVNYNQRPNGTAGLD